MTETTIATRMTKIFTDDERNRVKVNCSGPETSLSVDVHKMSRIECMTFLKNLIALFRGSFSVTVIHGYNNGTAIRDMVRNEKISPKVTSIRWDTHNDGVTRLCVRGLCC